MNYATVVALAFWVAPEIHGFFALASIPAGLTGLIGSMGLGELVVKEQSEVFDSKLPGYWFLIALAACLSFLLSLLVSWGLAIFYADEYDFRSMLFYGGLLSFSAPLGTARSMMESIQVRAMNFKRIGVVSVVSFALGTVPALILGAYGYGYWAMSIKFLLPHVLYLPLGFWLYRQQVTFKYDPDFFHTIKRFSGYFTLNNLINYFVRNVDYLIIGKFFPASVLGQYAIAYKILLFPMKNVTSRIVQVGTPLMAKLKHGGKDFKRKYFLMVQSIAVMVLPAMLLLFLVSKTIVTITFREGYDLLPMMISYLALLGAVQALVSPVGILYVFREEMQLMTINSIIALTVFSLGLLWSCTTEKIETVLLVYALSYIIFLMPNSQYWIFRRYGFSMVDFGIAFLPYLAACAPSFILTWLWLDWSPEGNPWWLLFSSGGLFVGVYYVALKFLNRWSEEERLYVSLFKRLGI